MWYSNGSDVWGYRRAITVDNTAGTPGAPVDVTITLPASDDELWDNLRSAGQVGHGAGDFQAAVDAAA